MRWRFQRTGCHLGAGKLDDGRFYACYSRDWPEGIVRRKRDENTYEVLFRCKDDFGPPALAEVITEEEAKELVREHKGHRPGLTPKVRQALQYTSILLNIYVK